MTEHIIGGRREDVVRVADKQDLSKSSGKDFLQGTLVESLFPEQRTKIITVQCTDPVITAFQTLIEHKILSVPVFDSQRRSYNGFIDMLDVVYTIVALSSEVELTGGSLSQLLNKSEQLRKTTCGQVVDASGRNPYYRVEDNAPLLAAIELMATHRVHRIPIVNHDGELISIVTQSHLVRLIHRNIGKFAKFAALTVQELKLGFKQVHSLTESHKTIEAFRTIHDKKVSGLAVVSESGELVGNISASDMRLIGGDVQNLSRVFMPIAQFLDLHPKDDSKLPGPYCVVSSSTMEEVMFKFVLTGAHRVYTVDQEKKPIGVISLGDLLEAILKHLD